MVTDKLRCIYTLYLSDPLILLSLLRFGKDRWSQLISLYIYIISIYIYTLYLSNPLCNLPFFCPKKNRFGKDRWSQQAKVRGLDTGPFDQFGFSVALNGVTETVAVGAPGAMDSGPQTFQV
jgi:hypothetical protein